ncbi:MAG TPA: carbohydrate ABC transporter permease [Solirubrobacteraceae bacterium]|nr:carbohydrate ABC transporter permease [Solirubrobacteraceae bacterium]
MIVLLWSLFPLYWGLNTSLMSTGAADSVPLRLYPHPLYGANYADLLSLKQSGFSGLASQLQKALLNSTIESVGSTLLTVVVAIFSAYAFARLEFRFKRLILVTTIATLLLPAYATLLPLYKIMSGWGLVNTYLGVILVNASGFIPLAVWVLYNYFTGLPRELEEAALVDGASPLGTLWRIILPLSVPGIAAAAAITFLFSWAQFLFPLIMTTDLGSQPATVTIAALYGPRLVAFSVMAAAGMLAIAIPGALSLLLNRYIVTGLTAGSNR